MCPVTNCQAQMSPLEMLAHLMMRHSPQDSMIEIAEDVPKQYEVDIDKLTPGRNHSIGVIAYEGAPKPGLSCAVTSDLQIVHHLPIILMLYVSPPILNTEQAYILYLVSAVPSSLVSANVTLLDGFHAHEKRGWRCLRNSLDSPLMDSQNRLATRTTSCTRPPTFGSCASPESSVGSSSRSCYTASPIPSKWTPSKRCPDE